MIDIKIRFGTRVREIRKQKKLSQEGLAQKSGLHRTYVSDIERGMKNISIENIEKIANALGIDLSLLF